MKVITQCSLRFEAGGQLFPPETPVDLSKKDADPLLERRLIRMPQDETAAVEEPGAEDEPGGSGRGKGQGGKAT